jgi:hypothetical protein
MQQHDRLTVTVPPSSLFASWIGLAIFLVLPISFLLVLHAAKRSEEKLRTQYPGHDSRSFEKRLRAGYVAFAAITIGTPLFFLAVGYSKGSIVLDRVTNRATVTTKMTAFLPSQLQSVDLTSVTGATLDFKPNSRRIRLNVTNGPDLAYPLWSDRAGQDKAVDAINHFLEAH